MKDNDIRLIAYAPDNALTPLIASVSAENYFLPVGATGEGVHRRRTKRWVGDLDIWIK